MPVTPKTNLHFQMSGTLSPNVTNAVTGELSWGVSNPVYSGKYKDDLETVSPFSAVLAASGGQQRVPKPVFEDDFGWFLTDTTP